MEIWHVKENSRFLKNLLNAFGHTNTEQLLKSYDRAINYKHNYKEDSVKVTGAIFWNECRDILSRPQYFCYLDRANLIEVILNELQETDEFYNMSTAVMDYLRENAFEDMPFPASVGQSRSPAAVCLYRQMWGRCEILCHKHRDISLLSNPYFFLNRGVNRTLVKQFVQFHYFLLIFLLTLILILAYNIFRKVRVVSHCLYDIRTE
jgi:hypothetical protein